MSNKRFQIRGRVISEERPVRGASVLVWNVGDARRDDPVRRVVTDADGRYALDMYCARKTLTPGGKARVRLVIEDLGGRRLWSSGKRALSSDSKRPLEKNVVLEASLVEAHVKEIRVPDRGAGLVDRRRIRQLREGLSRLGGTPARERIASRARRYGLRGICPGPDFVLIDSLVRDAWRVLDGDPIAPVEFLEKLELVHHFSVGPQIDGPNYPDHETAKIPLSRRFTGDPSRGSDGNRAVERPTSEDFPINADASAALQLAARQAGGLLSQSRGEGWPSGASLHLGRAFDILCVLAGLEPLLRLGAAASDGRPAQVGRLGELTDLVGWECGPDDGPVPVWPWPKRPRCRWIPEIPELWPDPCFYLPFYAFQVDEVSPGQACAGALVTITGERFGVDTGMVFFRSASDSASEVLAQVVSWSDTAIVVRVPVGATCGVRVAPRPITRVLCGRLITLTPVGFVSELFEGSAAGVRVFAVDGDTRNEICIKPDQVVQVSWDTCAADRVDIEILDQAGTAVVSQLNSPNSGSFSWDVPPTNTSLQYTATITVSGACSPATTTQTVTIWVEEPATLSVRGIEVTQAIQYYRSSEHLTDADDQAPDNSARLVVGKAAWVRVYVRSGVPLTFNAGQLAAVSGVLEVHRITGGVASLVQVLSPQPPGSVVAEADPVYADERGNIAASLNFVIPAAQMTGRLRLRAVISSSNEHCRAVPAEYTTTVDVDLDQTLQIAAVLVDYDGPPTGGGANIVLPAPTLEQVRSGLGWSLAVMPVHTADSLAQVRSAGTLQLTDPLNDARSCPGCCSPNWVALGAAVAEVAANDGNQANWIYYGFVPTGVPLAVGGCRSNGVATGPIGGQITTAHEITHDLGRPHAPCGNVGAFDATYPAYEPYDAADTPRATLGEYGLDIRSGVIHPPTQNDFMSYCGPRWISMHNHMMLQGPPGLPSTSISVGFGELTNEGAPEKLIHVLGTLDEDDEVVLRSVRRVTTRRPNTGPAMPGMQIAALDREGTKVGWSRLYRATHQASTDSAGGCACGEGDTPFEFVAFLPDLPCASLEFRRGKEHRLLRSAPSRKPSLTAAKARMTRDGKLRLTWKKKSFGAESVVWARYSVDRGKTWRGLATGLEGNGASLDVSSVPTGKIHVELSLHDGFNVARLTMRDVSIPARPPVVGIVHPIEPVKSGTLLLWGTAVASDGSPVRPEECKWLIDGKEIGTGTEVFLPTPARGSYKLTFSAQDENGRGRASQELEIT